MITFPYWQLFTVLILWSVPFYFWGRQHMKSRVDKLTKANSSLIADLNTGLTLTPQQRDDNARIVQEHIKLNEEQNNVIVYIRDNHKEYLDGRFTSFSQLVIALIKMANPIPHKKYDS